MICWKRALAAIFAFGIVTAPARADGPMQQPGVWAQDYTGRAADPAIRFGRLPNGLRYAILHNAVPARHMSLRLDIGSGSAAETDAEQGLAHFLEHMAFRGSTHVSDGEMLRVLARYGLAFGPDLNASTGQLATIYKLDFPRSADADLTTGLMLLREIASDLTIAPEAVDAERGVVLSEERLRDVSRFHQQKALIDAWLPGQLSTRRWPIGRVDVLRQANAAQLRGFYEREYRPDNAVLVAVGDFDPAVMQDMIEQRFADWTAHGALARPDLGRPAAGGPRAALFSEPAAPNLEDVALLRPYDAAADTDAHAARTTQRLLARQILANRLTELSHRAESPISGFSLYVGSFARSAEVTELTVDAAPDRWPAAMREAVLAERRLLQSGATQAELDRAIAERRATLAAAVGQVGTRTTVGLADAIVANAIADTVTRSPAQTAAEFDALAATTDLATMGTAVHDILSGAGPIAFLSTAQAPEGGVDAVRRVLETAMAEPVDGSRAAASDAVAEWPYTRFGAPGAVVERDAFAELGTTVVRFANGTVLSIRPIPSDKGRVAAAVGFGHGRLGLPPDLAHAYWLLTGPAFLGGGTGRLTVDDVQRAAALRSSALRFAIEDRSFALKVQTVPDRLDFALQLSAAYLTDPGFRAPSVERAKTLMAAGLPSLEGSEERVLARAEARALHGGDPRWALIPTAADVAATRPDDLRSLLQAELLAGPPQVVVVGDVDVERTIASVAATLGALPAAGPADTRLGAPVQFPAARPDALTLTHRGRSDQALAVVTWPTQDFYTSPADARALDVAGGIIRQRLVEGLRETDGATYSPNVRTTASETVAGYGYLAVTVEVPPGKIELFRRRLADAVAQLQRAPVSDDELRRAREPIMRRRIAQMQTEEYWLDLLLTRPLEARVRETIRTRVTGIEAVTAADVQAVVARYLGRTPFVIEVIAAAP